MSPAALASVDLAAMNLACAAGLPGSEKLDIPACLATLDRWADAVRRYTRDCRAQYYEDPDHYHRHKGFFHFLCMVTLLKHPNGFACAYQPAAIGNFDFLDARDDFLHGLLTRKLGTCASFPVLCVALGRRLGYPMHLALAKGHVLCQWVDADGTHANLECASGGGGEMCPDGHYHRWPHPLTPAQLAGGRYLRPLAPHEALALFLETRGHVLTDNLRFGEAEAAYRAALRAAPGWTTAGLSLRHVAARRAAVPFTPGPLDHVRGATFCTGA